MNIFEKESMLNAGTHWRELIFVGLAALKLAGVMLEVRDRHNEAVVAYNRGDERDENALFEIKYYGLLYGEMENTAKVFLHASSKDACEVLFVQLCQKLELVGMYVPSDHEKEAVLRDFTSIVVLKVRSFIEKEPGEKIVTL